MNTRRHLFLPFLLFVSWAQAQTYTQLIDTLVVEHFTIDPTFNMLPFPTGDDATWVNYDVDERPTSCAEIGQPPVPGNWFWESDLGDTTATGENYCYTSCSYVVGNAAHPNNINWLILPRVEIPDSSYFLSWRSSSILGPAFVDGYKVLVSTGSNAPFDFQYSDTLFKAAEMIGEPTVITLDPTDYNYTPGYIHANTYTNDAYYFLALSDNGAGGGVEYLHGKLEPHSVSLAAFADQSIYIAFVHDSEQDFLLQIDDILVSNSPTSGAGEPNLIALFQSYPNPVVDELFLQWTLKRPAESELTITDARGMTVHRQHFGRFDDSWCRVTSHAWPAGLYVATLRSEGKVASRKLMKL
ncbi:MAG: T9SS type A sorting domain-containing protein [Saprospiraceae bacterium]|nr:T9SS type A sorting domain-containing protein [Saprospiraceae bacterium]